MFFFVMVLVMGRRFVNLEARLPTNFKLKDEGQTGVINKRDFEKISIHLSTHTMYLQISCKKGLLKCFKNDFF